MKPRSVLAGAAVAAALILGGVAPGRAAVIGATVGTSPNQVLAAPILAPRHFLELDNESTGSPAPTIACAFGGATPALNSAGSYTIPAGGQRIWDSTWYSSWDAIACISSAAGGQLTIEYQ